MASNYKLNIFVDRTAVRDPFDTLEGGSYDLCFIRYNFNAHHVKCLRLCGKFIHISEKFKISVRVFKY